MQTVLVQDEALKLANARIEQLQAPAGGSAQAPRGLLDNMRDGLFAHPEECRASSLPPASAPQRLTMISEADRTTCKADEAQFYR